MSDAPRMPLARARAAADHLLKRWGMEPHACMVVGSIRRGLPEVGDIDLVAPLPERPFDALYERIIPTCIRQEDLFPGEDQAFAEEIAGLKKGFLACQLRVQLAGVTLEEKPVVIPVQIFRYTPANRGWTELRCTGPREFGMWFLSRWKARFDIPAGEAHKASVDGHLVDPHRRVIPVESEADAFHKCGVSWIPPEDRAAFIERQHRSREQHQRETLR